MSLEERVAEMPIRALLLLAGCACLLAGFGATAASAKTKGGDLRVVETSGGTLAEFRQYTGTTRIKTDPGADCFGSGTGGSGARVNVPGSTALGLVADGAKNAKRLRPLSVTDFFGFGLGLCGIGGLESSGSSFWYLKVNHVGSQVGGDQTRVQRGYEVLWYLTPSFPPPPELVLEAPARVRAGEPFQVRVLAYADDGTAEPADGAAVIGADDITDADGEASVTLQAGTLALRATRETDIPSNVVTVCASEKLSDCAPVAGKRIFGTSKRDRIKGTRGDDRIKARAGRDRITIRAGGEDKVNCGEGRDKVNVKRRDDDDKIARNCEVING
jgi:Ca2+-binding RTX toxin-like protein